MSLMKLVTEINAQIESSYDRRVELAINLAKARDLVRKKDAEAKGIKWKAFATKHFDLSWSEVKKRVRIGSSDDPRKAMTDQREKDRISAAKTREYKKKNGSPVGAQPGAGAAWGGDNRKSNGENGGLEPGTVEQQRDRIIHAYEAADDEAHNLFHDWLHDKCGYEVVPRHPSAELEKEQRLTDPAM